jgi:hypothetical protein
MQNPDNARKLIANHSVNNTGDKKVNSSLETDSEFVRVGGANSELDALLDDILKEKQ